MRYYIEESLEDFKAWSGAKDTLNKLIELARVEEVENYINEFMKNASDTEINNLLWLKSDFIFKELLGYTEEEVNGLYRDMYGELLGYTEEEIKVLRDFKKNKK